MAVKPNLSTITNTNGGGTVAPSSDSLTYEERVKRIEDKLKELREKQLAEQQEKQRIENQRQTTANRITDAYNNSTNTFNEAQQKAQNYASGWTDGAAPVDSLTKAKQEQDALARYAELYSGEVNKSLGDGAAVNLYDAAKTNAQNLNETRNAVRAQRDLYSQYTNKEDYENDQRLYSMSSDELLKEINKVQSEVAAEKDKHRTFMGVGYTVDDDGKYHWIGNGSDNYNTVDKLNDQILKLNSIYNAKKYSENAQKYGVDPQSMSYNDLISEIHNSTGDKRTFLEDYYDSVGESNLQTKRAAEWYAGLSRDQQKVYDELWDNAYSLSLRTGNLGNVRAEQIMKESLVKNGYSQKEADEISDLYSRYYSRMENFRTQKKVSEFASEHPILSPIAVGAAKVLTAPLEAATVPLSTIESQYTGKAIDPNRGTFIINRAYETATDAATNSAKWNEGVLGAINGAVEKVFGESGSKVMKSALYSGIEDGIRNLALLPLGGAVSTEAIAAIGALLASSGAGMTEFRQRIENGENNMEALTRALITSGIEYATEAIGGEYVWNKILGSGTEGFFEAVTKAALAEGTEEVMGNIGQRLFNGLSSDNIKKIFEASLNGYGSFTKELINTTGWVQDVKAYKEQGLSTDDALKRAFGDWVSEDAEAFLSAFLSAGVSAGGTKAINLSNRNATDKQINNLTGNSLTRTIRSVSDSLTSVNRQIADAVSKNEQPKVTKEEATKNALNTIENYRERLAEARNVFTNKAYVEQNPEFSAQKRTQIESAIDTLETVRNAVAQGDTSVLNNIVDTAEKEITARARERAENAKIQRQVKNTVSNYVNDLVMSGKRMSQIEADLNTEINTLTAQQNLTDEQKKRLSFDQNAVAYMETEAKNDVIKRADADLARALRQAGHEGIADGVTIKWDFNWNDDYRNADYNKSTRTITLNPYARDTKALASFVIAHELTHHLRAQGNTDLITDTWEKMQSLMDVGFLSRSDLRYNLDSMRELYKQDLDRYIETGEGREEIAALVKSGMSEQDAINKARDNYIIEEAVANFFGDAAANYVTGKSGTIYNLNGVNSFTDEQIRDINKGQKTFNIGALISNESKNSVRGILRAIGENLRNFARKLAGKDPVTAKHFDTLADAYRDLAERVYNDQRKELGMGENEAQEAQSEAREDENQQEEYDPEYDGRDAVPIAESESGETLSEELRGGTVIKSSRSSWEATDKTAVYNALVGAGFSKTDSRKYIDQVNSISAIIASDLARLDYKAADNQKFMKPNDEYVITLDASTLCAKRLLYQGTFDKIAHILKDNILMPEDLIELSNMLNKDGYITPCGICYVESRRRHLSRFASEWRDKYNGEYKPSLDELTTTDGLENLRKTHNDVYTAFVDAMNEKGSANPKVVQLRTDYRGDINTLTKGQIDKILRIGGVRIQSFSDFETPHLIDMMQAILDMSAKNLTAQAYTKVPNFAWVFGDTGIKINLSLIGDIDENGNLTFSSKEGMDFDEAMRLRKKYSKNVGTILVGKNKAHILAAMADPRIDYIIPFHKSGWSADELRLMESLAGFEDYTNYQNERIILGKKHKSVSKKTERGVDSWMAKNKGKYTDINVIKNDNGYTIEYTDGYETESFDAHKERTGESLANYTPVGPDAYWDFNKSGKENAEIYLKKCADSGRLPKFWNFLVDNGDGSFSLQPDGSTDGYWKTLIDFKMYDNDGRGSPQLEVKPNFNMDEADRVLKEYEGGANTLPSASDEFIQRYVDHYRETHKDSTRNSRSVTPEENARYMDLAKDPAKNEAELQKMVDGAARRSGYPLKVYHGTRSFGFTKFDTGKSDDGISLFATNMIQTAETYSGKTKRTRITDKVEKNADDIHGEDLISEAAKYNKRYDGYKLMTDKDKEIVSNDAKDDIEWSIEQAKVFARDNRDAFDSDKNAIMDRLISALYHVHDSDTDSDLEDAFREWEDAVWDLKWMDDSIAIEFLGAVDSLGLYNAKNILSDMMYDGDMYALWNGGAADYIFDNELQIELNAEYHKGIYELYGKPGKQLVVDTDGENWNQITPPQELQDYGLYGLQTTREISSAAKALGYDSVLFRGLRDNGGETPYNGKSDVYVFFDANALKSADPVTYDDSGNVIPLSERFNENEEDIRYSKSIDTDSLRKPTDLVELNDKQLSNREKTENNTVVGSALYTLGGNVIKRFRNVVGKNLGTDKSPQVYLHKSAVDAAEKADILPRGMFEKADALLREQRPDFSYNAIMYDAKNPNVIRFDEAPNFDTEREPVVGWQVKVDTENGTVANVSKTPSKTIWHHKWNWVTDDYDGFDQEEAWNWSKEWLSTITPVPEDTDLKYGGLTYKGVANGSSQEAWNEQLDLFDLPKDGEEIRSSRSVESAPIAQKHTSRGTSINTEKIPVLYTRANEKLNAFMPGTVNIDIGAGVEETPATAYLKELGVTSLPFDPFNRDIDTNRVVTDYLEDGNKADTATCSNVLNVIDTEEARDNVVLQMAKAIKPDGTAYFTVYENEEGLKAGKAGEVKSKPDQWQEFRKAKTYIPGIEKYFDDVKPKYGLIIAKKPKNNLPQAVWQIASKEYKNKEGVKPYDEDVAVRFSRSVPDTSDLKSKIAEQKRNIERLKEGNTYLKNLMANGRTRALSPEAVDRIVREVSDEFSLDRDPRIREMLKGIDAIQSGKLKDARRQEAFDALAEQAQTIIREADELNDPLAEERNALKNYFKGKVITATPEIEAELKGAGERWYDARNANRKYLNIARESEKGTISISSLWNELVSMRPDFFAEDVMNEPDMIRRVLDVMESLQPEWSPVYEGDMIEDAATALLSSVEAKYQKYSTESKRVQAERRGEERAERFYTARIDQIESEAARFADEARDMIHNLRMENAIRVAKGTAQEQFDAARKNAKYIHSAAVSPTSKKFVPQNAREAMNTFGTWIDSITTEGVIRSGMLDHNGQYYTADAIAQPVRPFLKTIADTYGDDVYMLADQLLTSIENYASIAQPPADAESKAIASKQLSLALYKLSQLLRSAIVNQNKVWLDGKRRDAETIGNSMIDALRSRKLKTKHFVSVEEKEGRLGNRAATIAKNRFTKASLDLTDAYSFLHELGTSGEALFDTLRAAQEYQTMRNEEFVTAMNDKLKGIELWKYTEPDNTVTFTDANKENKDMIRIPRGVAMSVLALWKRFAGREHLENGGFEYNTLRGKSDPIVVHKEQIDEIERQMTDNDKKVMDVMLSFMQDNCTVWGNEATMKRYGFNRFTTENYFKIDVDRFALPQTVINNLGEPLIENTSFAKQTKEGATSPVIASDFVRAVIKHVNGMATYSAYLNAEGTVNQILSTKGLADEMGSASVDYMKTLMTDLKSQTKKETDAITELFLKNQGVYKAAAVAYNLSTALKQPISYIRAAAVVDTKYLRRGMTMGTNGAQRAEAEMRKYSGTAVKKMNGYSETGAARDTAMLIGATKESFSRKFVEFGMKGAEFGDKITWAALWTACREETRDKNPSLDGEELLKATAKRFSSVVAQTQVTTSPLDTAPILRNSNPALRNLFAFWNEPLKSFNLLMRNFLDAVDTPKEQRKAALKTLGRAAAAILASQGAEAVVSAIFSSLRDEKDDDLTDAETWRKMLLLWSKELGANILGILPVVDQMWDLVSDTLNGYSNSDMALSLMTEPIDAVKDAVNATDGSARTKWTVWRKVIESISTLAGVPLKNILRTLRNTTKLGLHLSNDYVAEYKFEKWFYNPKNATARDKYGFADILTKAYLSGDERAFNEIRNDMVDMGISTSTIIRSIVKTAYPEDAEGTNGALKAYKPGSDAWNLTLKAIYDRKLSDPDALEQEITRLYEATGNTDALPNFASTKYTVNGEEYTLEGLVYTEYAENYAQRLYEVQTAIRNSNEYREADDAQKAWWMKKAEDVVGSILKYGLNQDYNVTSPGKWVADYVERSDGDIAQYIVQNTKKS